MTLVECVVVYMSDLVVVTWYVLSFDRNLKVVTDFTLLLPCLPVT